MVDRVVQPAALLPVARAGNDELGDGREVAELDEVAGEEEVPVVLADLVMQETDPLSGAREPALAAHDADVVPHEASDLVPVLRHDDGLVAVDRGARIPRSHGRRTAPVVMQAR